MRMLDGQNADPLRVSSGSNGRKSKSSPLQLTDGQEASPLPLELKRVEYRFITNIDTVAQAFDAHVFVQFLIPADVAGGTLREQLLDGGLDDENPKFKSAAWYLHMLGIYNMKDGEIQRLAVQTKDGGIEMNLTAQGTFLEKMELEEFPFDHQELSLHVRSSCADQGAAPMKLVIGKYGEDWVGTSSSDLFMLTNLWSIEDVVDGIAKPINANSVHRSYPGLEFTIHVHRRPGYYLVNVCAPTALFVALCFCQMGIERTEVSDRIGMTLTLLLTTVAYKFVTATMVPAVAYLTTLDKYVSVCTLLIVLSVVNAPLASALGDTYDLAFLWAIGGLYAAAHAWFIIRAFQTHGRRTKPQHSARPWREPVSEIKL